MAITSFFALSVDYVDENGNTQSGPSAVAKLKAMQKEWTGYLDEEKIRSVIEKNVEINNTEEAKSQNVSQNNIAYGWKQGINEIRSLLNCSYATGFRDYDYYIADGLSLDVAGDFYDNRIKLLKNWLEGEAKDQFSAKEKEYLINQYENIETPFYYDYMNGWQQLFEFAPTIIMLTMIILGFLVAGIFANESAWKADAIFFSCTYGRNKAIISKIAAGFLIVTVVYIITFGVFTGIVLLYLGAVPILIVLYIVLSIVLVPLLYRAYRHAQVS